MIHYQSDLQIYDFSVTSNLSNYGFTYDGTHTFTKTFDYDIDAVLSVISEICLRSGTATSETKCYSIVESITINNNILTVIVRYRGVGRILFGSGVFRISLMTCIQGR